MRGYNKWTYSWEIKKKVTLSCQSL